MVANSDQSDRALRVLVVEDEYFIAQEIMLGLEGIGALVLGPVGKLDDAMRIVTEQKPGAAVLDVNLHGEMAFTLADQLTALAIPFIFATGYDAQSIPERFQHVPRWEKPFDAKALAGALADMAGERMLKRH